MTEEKENLQVLGNIGSGHYQTSGDKKLFTNKVSQITREPAEE